MFSSKFKSALIVVCLWQCFTIGVLAQQTFFPTDVAWKNIKTDYGARGDGVTDDTAAFQQAFSTLINPFNSRIAIYVPSGTYIVSDRIATLQGFFDCCLTLQGENPATTIIKLKDNAAGFQDPANPRPVFYTRAGNQAFGMYFFNLTINTGASNEGAVGIDYISSNYGAIKDVNIISPDGSGFSGVEMIREWAGPSILKRVRIDNFQYGIRIATCEYSMTFENITLNNQTVAGIHNSCNTISVRKLVSTNTVPAIVNNGARTILLDSQLNGGSSANQAIVSSAGSFLFARNVTTTGYANAIRDGSTNIPGANVTEYRNNPDYSLFPNNGKTLNLPVEETPEHVNNNPADWANVRTFGAQPANPQFGFFDATPGIQAALNSGKKVIYFGQMGDNGTVYCIYGDIVIPPTVEKIIGLSSSNFAFFNNSRFIINDAGTPLLAAPPLFIERISGARLLNNSSRTLVVKHASLIYQNTAANTGGKVFLEDFGERFEPQFPVKLWARQLNPEVQPENERNIDNPGGQYWILGLKTEGRANIIRTTSGGASELLGALVYPASSFSGTTQQAFTIENARMSLTGLTMTSYVNNGWYGIAVRETQGAETQTLAANTIWSTSPYNFSFYASKPLIPTAAQTTVSGRVTDAGGRALRDVQVTLLNDSGAARVVGTNSFGYYSFGDVSTGATYTLSVSSKKYRFATPSRVLTVVDEVTDANFIGEE